MLGKLVYLNQVGLVSVCAKFQLPTKSKSLLSDALAVAVGVAQAMWSVAQAMWDRLHRLCGGLL